MKPVRTETFEPQMHRAVVVTLPPQTPLFSTAAQAPTAEVVHLLPGSQGSAIEQWEFTTPEVLPAKR